jgi:hypothetical protein
MIIFQKYKHINIFKEYLDIDFPNLGKLCTTMLMGMSNAMS